tara:strand:- start:622 stop:1320 length:699 start_codon:yes stop_codon:yes gene_type:complete
MAIKWAPELPDPNTLRPEEIDAYNFMLSRVKGSEEANIGTIDGEPYGAAYFRALANSPIIGEALGRLGSTAMELPGKPGTLSAAEHEFIDAIIAFDSDYTWLMAGHAPLAIKAGVRIQALEALRDKQEDRLTEDEKELVEFTRAVRDGTVTSEIWKRLITKMGSERGAIEYSFFVLLVLLNHLLAKAMGVPDMSPDELTIMFKKFNEEGGEPASYKSYAQLYGDAPFKTHED